MIPPGVHRVVVDPGAGELGEGGLWVTVEELRRIPIIGEPAAESYLARGERPEELAIAALLEGDLADAVARLRALGSHWSTVWGLDVATRLGDWDAADELYRKLREFAATVAAERRVDVDLAGLEYGMRRRRPEAAQRHAASILANPHAAAADTGLAVIARMILDPPAEARSWTWPGVEMPRRRLHETLRGSLVGAPGWRSLVPSSAAGSPRRVWVTMTSTAADERERAIEWAWRRARSAPGRGPWLSADGEGALGRLRGTGVVEAMLVGAGDAVWSLEAGGRTLASVSDAEGVRSRCFSWASVAPETMLRAARRSGGDGEQRFVWRSTDVRTELRDVNDAAGVPEISWGSTETLFPIADGDPIAFEASESRYGGVARVTVRVPEVAAGHVDVPVLIAVAGRHVTTRRCIRIASSETALEMVPPVFQLPVLLPAGKPIVEVTVPGRAAGVAVGERRRRSAPGDLLIHLSRDGRRAAEAPWNVWSELREVTAEGDPEAVAELGRQIETTDGVERARLLLQRGRLQLRASALVSARADWTLAERLFTESRFADVAEELFTVRVHLSSLAVERLRFAEARHWVLTALASGRRSPALAVLAAVVALGNGDRARARGWIDVADVAGELSQSSRDLREWVAAELDRSAGPAVQDPYVQVLAQLSQLRRATGNAPRAAIADMLRELQALLRHTALEFEAQQRITRAERLRRWHEEARLALHALAVGHWPPAPGFLDPFASPRSLPTETMLEVPRRVDLGSDLVSWGTWWMEPGDRVRLELPGPDLYEVRWRSAHRTGSRFAAPARWRLSDGDTPRGVRSVLASEPSPDVRVVAGRMPKTTPGRVDAKLFAVEAPTAQCTLQLDAGSGFLTVQRASARIDGAWGWPLDGITGGDVAAAELAGVPQLLSRDDLDLRHDLDLRVAALRAGHAAAPERVTELADDLLFIALSRPRSVRPNDVLLALTLYERLPPDRHRRRHRGLALLLSDWRTVDLLATHPEYRTLRVTQDEMRTLERRMSLASAAGLPGVGTSAVVNGNTPIRWRHESDAPESSRLRIVADHASSDGEGDIELLVEMNGEPFLDETLEPGRASEVVFPPATEADFSVRVAGAFASSSIRVRLTLLRAGAKQPQSLLPEEQRLRVYRGTAIRKVPVPAPTLYRVERWHADDIVRGDGRDWSPEERPRVETGSAPELGAVAVDVTADRDEYLRLSVRGFDRDTHSRLVEKIPPRVSLRDLAEEAPEDAPPFLEWAPWNIPEGELQKLPLIVELFTEPVARDEPSVRNRDEESIRDEVRGGARLHLGRWPLFTRLTAAEIFPDGQKPVTYGELMLHHYFDADPRFDARIAGRLWHQALPVGEEDSFEIRGRLRARAHLTERLEISQSAGFSRWNSSVSSGDLQLQPDEIYRRVFSDYRADHRHWIELTTKLRYTLYQNVLVEPYVVDRTNEDLDPSAPDRVSMGVRVLGHVDNWIADVDFERTERFRDDDRRHRAHDDVLGTTFGYEGWLSPGKWMSVLFRGEYSLSDESYVIGVAAVFRFGGRNGHRLQPVDPESRRFSRYQDSTYPWGPR